MDHEESVYNLLPKPAPTQQRTVMYRSKYPGNTPPTCSTFGASTAAAVPYTNVDGSFEELQRVHSYKRSGALLGPKGDHYPDPTSFQKKQTRADLPQPHKFEYGDRRKPALESHTTTTRELPKQRNFVTENAIAAIMSETKHAPSQPDYLKKSTYGKVPNYLGRVKTQIVQEQEIVRAAMKKEKEEETKYQHKVRPLSEEERQELVENLKKKWAHVNNEYQKITHNVSLDTMGKVKRKESYESQLTELERAIERLSKKTVYVEDTF